MKEMLLTLAAAGALFVPAALQARPFYGPRVAVVGGPAFGLGWYDPYVWGPAYPSYYSSPTGNVKFDNAAKEDEVFVNGAFAGTIAKNRTLHLRPGSYNVELRQEGQNILHQQVYVMAGKTLHLEPSLTSQYRP